MHELARYGHNIIAVAKDEERLRATVAKHREMHAVSIESIAKDLTLKASLQELYEDLKARGIQIDILVNNAGVSYRSPFAAAPMDRLIEIIRLDIEALTRLTRLFLADMVERNDGMVLNVGSIAWFQPGPLMGTYHGAKVMGQRHT